MLLQWQLELLLKALLIQYKTPVIIYNTWWFEAIHIFFLINFFGNISRYQLWKKEKWATLLLHLSFIFIIVGAAITRYISYEGMMPIREGEASNQVYSDKNYLTYFVDGQYQGEMRRRVFEHPLLFSSVSLSPIADNHFNFKDKFNETSFR